MINRRIICDWCEKKVEKSENALYEYLTLDVCAESISPIDGMPAKISKELERDINVTSRFNSLDLDKYLDLDVELEMCLECFKALMDRRTNFKEI